METTQDDIILQTAKERYKETAEKLKVNDGKRIATLIELGQFIQAIIETLEKTIQSSLFPKYDDEQLKIWRKTFELYKQDYEREVEAQKQKSRQYEAKRQAKRQRQSYELIATHSTILRLRPNDTNIIDWEQSEMSEDAKRRYDSLTIAQQNRIAQAKNCAIIWASDETTAIDKRGYVIIADWKIRETLEKLTGRKVQQNEIDEIIQAFTDMSSIRYNVVATGLKDDNGKPVSLEYSAPLFSLEEVLTVNGKRAVGIKLSRIFFGQHQIRRGEQRPETKSEATIYKPVGVLGVTARESAFYGILNTQSHARETELLKVCGLVDEQKRNKKRSISTLQDMFVTASRHGYIETWDFYANPTGETVYKWKTAGFKPKGTDEDKNQTTKRKRKATSK